MNQAFPEPLCSISGVTICLYEGGTPVFEPEELKHLGIDLLLRHTICVRKTTVDENRRFSVSFRVYSNR